MLWILLVLLVVNVALSVAVVRRARELHELAVSVAGLGNIMNETLEALSALIGGMEAAIKAAPDLQQLTLRLMEADKPRERATVAGRVHRQSFAHASPSSPRATTVSESDPNARADDDAPDSNFDATGAPH